jgi:ribosomal protein L31E
MKQYTVNLSRARAAGGKNRARKAINILREELEKKEGKVTLSREINQEIWKNGAAKPPAKITVEIENREGVKHATLAEQKRPNSKDASKEGDYSQIMSGTVSEAKTAIEEMEDPNLQTLLEAEKESGNRKTLKDWIKAQKE